MKALIFRQPGWHAQAWCLPGNHSDEQKDVHDAAFSDRDNKDRAKAFAEKFCAACPVRIDCAQDAVDNRIENGVWGGFLTDRSRRKFLAEHAARQGE